MKSLIEKYKDNIIDLYVNKKKSSTEISNLFYVSRSTICRLLKRNGIIARDNSHRKQKYSINETIFEKIDTPEKSYWLGLLYADGSHVISKNEIKIFLQECDSELIKGFQSFINYTGPLIKRTFKIKHPTWSDQLGCSITNKKLSQDLLKAGLFQNKTYSLIFPTFISKHLISHFIRGFFDGDGSISISLRKNENKLQGSFCIAAPIKFLDSIQDIFINELGFNKMKYSNLRTKNPIVKVLSYSGSHNLLKLREYLYQNSTICLTRKKEKFDKVQVYRRRRSQNI
ncbi:MAG TPA: LAGLIDADG family homing endonuclease [Methanofastidiosum sp.]|nr:LAGLIDADG family homing endonuclease [Methanofastidiosum sp.]